MVFKSARGAAALAFTLSAALAAGWAAPAVAQEAPPPDTGGSFLDKPNSLTVGVGAVYLPSYEGSNDYVVTPGVIAIGKLDGFSFVTRGTSLSIDLIRDPADAPVSFELGPVANLRLDRTGRIRDPQVLALGKIHHAIELGGVIGISKNRLIDPYDSLTFRISYQHDVSGTHDSGIWAPEIQYQTPVSIRTYVLLDAQANHVAGRFADTYFSITPAGSLRSGLPVYDAHGGWKDYRISLLIGQVLIGDLRRPHLSLFGGVSYSRELGNFARSPIVAIAGSPNQYLAAAGLAYTF